MLIFTRYSCYLTLNSVPPPPSLPFHRTVVSVAANSCLCPIHPCTTTASGATLFAQQVVDCLWGLKGVLEGSHSPLYHPFTGGPHWSLEWSPDQNPKLGLSSSLQGFPGRCFLQISHFGLCPKPASLLQHPDAPISNLPMAQEGDFLPTPTLGFYWVTMDKYEPNPKLN